jgi:hypothetical protein
LGLTSVYDAEVNELEFVLHGITLDVEEFSQRENFNLVIATNADVEETANLVFAFYKSGQIGKIVLVDEDSAIDYQDSAQFKTWLTEAKKKRDDYRAALQAIKNRRNIR